MLEARAVLVGAAILTGQCGVVQREVVLAVPGIGPRQSAMGSGIVRLARQYPFVLGDGGPAGLLLFRQRTGVLEAQLGIVMVGERPLEILDRIFPSISVTRPAQMIRLFQGDLAVVGKALEIAIVLGHGLVGKTLRLIGQPELTHGLS